MTTVGDPGVRPVAIVSPHFDDAVLSCWHVLAGRGDVAVVNVCTGCPPVGTMAPWWDRLTGAQDPVVRMQERAQEDRRALAHAGRESVDLGLLDSQYGGSGRSATWLAALLGSLLPVGTIVCAPAALGRHPDHEMARDAALELARDGRPVVLYADLPHGLAEGWPTWVSGVPAGPGLDVDADWDEVLRDAGLDQARLVRRVCPLDASTRERKLRALAEYRTQRAALDTFTFAPLADPRALAFEVNWTVPSAALALPTT